MYAVVKTGGKQYRVSEGDKVRVEKIEVEEGSTVDLDRVLLIADGEQVTVGTPYIDGGKVTGKVVAQGRAKKVDVIKFKRRKKYRRSHGHRQAFTELEITSISPASGGPSPAPATDE